MKEADDILKANGINNEVIRAYIEWLVFARPDPIVVDINNL